MLTLFRLVPKHLLSFLVGKIADIPIPHFARSIILGWLVSIFRIKREEIPLPLNEYPSFAKLFTREIKPSLRPIEGPLAFPVDATLRGYGLSEDGHLPQIKGIRYRIEDLLCDKKNAEHFSQSIFFNLYLSPKDYHHVHAPCRGQLEKLVHIPGSLWPVNDWSMSRVPQLFCVNERVVLYLNTAYGRCVVVMVGATNVGKMTFPFCELITNKSPLNCGHTVKEYRFECPLEVQCGDKLGTFHLGSSVVLLFEPTSLTLEEMNSFTEVKLGMKLPLAAEVSLD